MSEISRRKFLKFFLNVPGFFAVTTSFSPERALAFIGTRVRRAKKVIIYTSGKLFGWGSNSYGQLGVGHITNVSTPIQTGALTTWTQVSTSGPHSLGIQEDGTLWSWGNNDDGQLGIGSSNRYFAVFEQISTFTDWISVAAGTNVCLAVRSNGTLWGWGSNGFGQLGTGSTADISSPTQIGSATNWLKVSCGGTYSLAIKSNGTLWSCGTSAFGQLGFTAASVSVFTQIGTATYWSQISAGGDHALALTTAGTLWGWGRNLYGSIGIGDTTRRSSPVQVGSGTDWTTIAAGLAYTSFALKSDGTLWGWGSNSYGHLGIGSTAAASSPVQVGSGTWSKVSVGYGYVAAIASDNTLWGWGTAYSVYISTPVQIGSASDWTSVAVSRFPSIAIRSNGTLWTWGVLFNYATGGAGDGSVYYSSPIQVGSSTDWTSVYGSDGFTLAKKTAGSIWGVGKNTEFQLGLPRADRSTPVQVGADTNWISIASPCYDSGYDMYYRGRSLAIKDDHTLWQWGYGLGLTPSQVGTESDWSKVCGVGANTSLLAKKNDGSIWSWGDNFYGWLGHGDTVSRVSPTRIGALTWIDISAGTNCYGGIRSDGTLWMWGTSYDGLLSSFRSSPVQIGSQTHWTALSIGLSLVLLRRNNGTLWSWNGTAVAQIGSDSTWQKIATYNGVHMAIKSNKSLWVWGAASNGELGKGATASFSTPVQLGAENKWLEVSVGYGSVLGVKHI